jgi:RHS repeat-associated protein
VSYTYNGIGRLTGETRTGTNAFTASYTLDGVGNRTSQTVGGSTTSFTLNADDELTATSGGFTNSYSYNANGEQTGRTLGGTAYSLSYDYDGQLTQITQGQTTTDFAYDALGRRFSRTAGGTTTEFVYGAGGMALEKQGGSYTLAYTQANGLLRRGSEYPLFDGHGSERTVTNSSQTVTGSVNYEAFGQVAGSSGSSTNPYMYAGDWGYRNDGDAGLMHVGARYYDAQVGRFITRDVDPDQHAYLYCEHEPVGMTDASGESPDRLGRGNRLRGGCDWLYSLSDEQLQKMLDDPNVYSETKAKIKRIQKARGKRRSGGHRGGSPRVGMEPIVDGIGIAVGIGIGWEVGKWLLAAVAAPETAGMSLIAAGAIP